MELNYDMIIKYLSPNKIIKSNKIQVQQFDKYNLDKFKFLNLYSPNSLVDSIIYLLDNDNFFINQEQMEKSREEFIKQIKLINNNLKDICKYFKINIIILSDQINIYSATSIIDLSLPFVLLYNIDNSYYPIFKENKKVFFYQNSEIEKLLDSDFQVNFDNYQFLDDLNQIIDNILNKPINIEKTKKSNQIIKENISEKKCNDNIFTTTNTIQDLEILKKKIKKELILDILEKDNSYKKSNLNKLKKNDLINILIKL